MIQRHTSQAAGAGKQEGTAMQLAHGVLAVSPPELLFWVLRIRHPIPE